MADLQASLGEIEYRPLKELAPFAGNPRKHPEKQLVKLTASMQQFGIPVPLLVSDTGEVIAGHARLEAARRLGMSEVPVIVACGWSAARIRAYRIADNRIAELAEWDDDLLRIELAALIEIDEMPVEILGFDMGEIDTLLEGDKRTGVATDPADALPDTPVEPVARVGDLWVLGKHRLMCGSSLDAEVWAGLMQGAVAAMIFQDAPYNVPINGHVSGLGKIRHDEFAMASGEMSKDSFTRFLADQLAAVVPHLKDGGVLTLAMDWRHSPEILAALSSQALELLNMCVWNKTNGGMGSLYRSKHELFWIARKGKAPHTNNVQLGRHGRYRTNVWDYAGVNTFGRSRMADLADHPTVKPVALVADAIRDVTKAGEIVLDGFMGSGTTLLAAERTGRVAYGIELEPRYIDVAIRRWEALSGKDARLSETGESFAEVAARRQHVAEPLSGVPEDAGETA